MPMVAWSSFLARTMSIIISMLPASFLQFERGQKFPKIHLHGYDIQQAKETNLIFAVHPSVSRIAVWLETYDSSSRGTIFDMVMTSSAQTTKLMVTIPGN